MKVGWYRRIYSKEIFVNKKNDALTNLNIENLEVVLDNHFYKFDEIHGILIPYNNFLDLKKNKNELKKIFLIGL